MLSEMPLSRQTARRSSAPRRRLSYRNIRVRGRENAFSETRSSRHRFLDTIDFHNVDASRNQQVRQSGSEEQILTDAGFYWREKVSVKVLVCKSLEDAGFANGFSTRPGGVSKFPEDSLNLAGFDEDPAENIYENRRRFLAALDSDLKLATAWQVHRVKVKVEGRGIYCQQRGAFRCSRFRPRGHAGRS